MDEKCKKAVACHNYFLRGGSVSLWAVLSVYFPAGVACSSFVPQTTDYTVEEMYFRGVPAPTTSSSTPVVVEAMEEETWSQASLLFSGFCFCFLIS